MVNLLICCPKAGAAISTGKKATSVVAFLSSPVFFGMTYCPHRRITHEWFAKDAWVGGDGCENYNARRSNPSRRTWRYLT
jgi:hypothetical protein